MSKVKILGAGGMLGSMIVSELAKTENVSVTATVRDSKQAEILSSEVPGVEITTFDAEFPDENLFEGGEWVINAIGVIKQYIKDENADDCRRALLVNSVFPHWLARAAADKGARVIQIATDCVYSGAKGQYVESDFHDALDVYGKTKSLGEAPLPTMTHLRCSIIGPEAAGRRSLLEWFLGQHEGAEVTGFTNHMWNGVTTLQFARLCLGIIRNPDLGASGMQHVVAREAMNKYDMLKAFAEGWGRDDVVIHSGEGGTAIDRTLATERPETNAALWRAAGYDQPPSVGEMIAELAAYDYRLKFD